MNNSTRSYFSIIDSVSAHNLEIFNAQPGPLDALFTYSDETNRNGKHTKDQMEH